MFSQVVACGATRIEIGDLGLGGRAVAGSTRDALLVILALGLLAAGCSSKDELTVDLGGGVTMELVLIRPGSFDMGSAKGIAAEQPVHKVTIKEPFYIGKYEVTADQWVAIEDPDFKGRRSGKPANLMTWDECQSFVSKLSERTKRRFSLPSEAEWEYACRAGSTTEHCCGDDEAVLGDYAWHDSSSEMWTTHPVGQKKPNQWGLFDMHGNVQEWCEDVWHDSYVGASSDGSAWLDGDDERLRVLRGGSMNDDPRGCRSAARRAEQATIASRDCGCRVVLRDDNGTMVIPTFVAYFLSCFLASLGVGLLLTGAVPGCALLAALIGAIPTVLLASYLKETGHEGSMTLVALAGCALGILLGWGIGLASRRG